MIVGAVTALGDAYSHANHYGFLHAEALLTGAVSAMLALLASYLLEDRGRRIRGAWTALRTRGGARRSELRAGVGRAARSPACERAQRSELR